MIKVIKNDSISIFIPLMVEVVPKSEVSSMLLDKVDTSIKIVCHNYETIILTNVKRIQYMSECYHPLTFFLNADLYAASIYSDREIVTFECRDGKTEVQTDFKLIDNDVDCN